MEKLCDACHSKEAVTSDYLCLGCQADYDSLMEAMASDQAIEEGVLS